MKTEMTGNDILQHFEIETNAESYGNGHINDTYLVTMPRYILQDQYLHFYQSGRTDG